MTGEFYKHQIRIRNMHKHSCDNVSYIDLMFCIRLTGTEVVAMFNKVVMFDTENVILTKDRL